MELQTLQDVREALKKVENYKKREKNKPRAYASIGKEYKKIDWSKKTISIKDAKKIFQKTLLPVQRKMRNYGWLKFVHDKNCTDGGYYGRNNVENLFLLQEQMCQMDDQFWRAKYKNTWKPVFVPFTFDSKYLGEINLCFYPKSREWKAPLLRDFLKNKQYIMDETCPFGRPLKEVREFVKNLMYSKVERWDYCFQRFLSENTK